MTSYMQTLRSMEIPLGMYKTPSNKSSTRLLNDMCHGGPNCSHWLNAKPSSKLIFWADNIRFPGCENIYRQPLLNHPNITTLQEHVHTVPQNMVDPGTIYLPFTVSQLRGASHLVNE